jgi:hypothetical protein
MLIGTSRALFGLAAIILPAAAFLFAAVSMVATSWRSWFGLQKKDDPPEIKKDTPHRTPRRTPRK